MKGNEYGKKIEKSEEPCLIWKKI